MNRCRNESVSAACFAMLLMTAVNFLWICGSVKLVFPFMWIFTPFWLWLLILSVQNYLVVSRKYTITKNALILTLSNGKTTAHPWSEISEIGICRVRYSARDDQHSVVFRIVIGQEPNGPASGFYGAWASELYELTHWKKIITIPYSDALHQQIAETVPVPLKDHRHIKKNAYCS